MLERGSTIGRYVVIDRLGAGGMGVVYAAFDPELDRKVAIKLLLGQDSPEARTRLTREAQALARLAHPNVITVHDVGAHGNAVFVAMELIDGSTVTACLKGRPRSWRETLAVFVDAGRGLAAAHAAGLVHRDFKPDNVMVGSDGRVRVMDFGLARGVTEGDEGEGGEQRAAPRTSVLDSDLTRAGARMGTPAYMAPEQHLGLPSDARTDQFGFCVALYEALYGERPFRGDSLTALALAVTEGRVAPAPAGTRVPNFVRRALLRGLSVEPGDRWPDMATLLEELGRDPGRTARWAFAIASGIAALVAVGVAIASSRASVCPDSAERLAGIWDGDAQTEVEAAFEASGLAFAGPTLVHVRAQIDAWTNEWVTMHEDSCLATHVRAEQSPELLDLRTACLNARLAELDAVLVRLRNADVGVVERAPELVADIGSLDRCADVDALRAPVPPPSDPEVRDRVAGVQGLIGEAQVAGRLGDFEEARITSEQATAIARELDYPPLLAETLLELCDAQRNAGDPEAAAQTLDEAFMAAAAGRRDDLVARAWLTHLHLTGDHGQMAQEALRYVPLAEAALVRAGDGRELRVSLEDTRAMLHEVAGDLVRAQEAYARVIAALDGERPRNDLRLAHVRMNHADVLRKLGRPVEAKVEFEAARSLIEDAYGPDHPAIATTLGGLALLAIAEGDPGTADAHWQRALALREQVLGPDHLELSITLVNLANLALDRGDPDRALAWTERAAKIRTGKYPDGHPRIVSLLGLEARAHLARGDVVAAEERFARAVASADAANRPTDPGYLHGLGTCRMNLGRPDEAVEPFERALELSGTGSDGTRTESLVARRRFSLATALHESGRDRERARDLAREARDVLAPAGPEHAQLLADIDDFLKSP